MPKISKSTRVERSIEDLSDLLGARPPEWLVPFASIAVHTGEAAGARRAVDSAPRGPRRVRRISIDLTDVPQGDDLMSVHAGLRWETSGFRWAFATFDGNIVATRESDDACTITLEGSYTAPASSSGRKGRDPAATAVVMLLSTLRAAFEEQARAGV